MSRETPRRYRGLRQEPQSMRVAGGTGAVISALASGLPKTNIRLGVRLTHIVLCGREVDVSFFTADGTKENVRAAHVLFALPPRLLEMIARCTGLVSVPAELNSEEAAPLLCAGLATFNALKKSGAEAGDLVAVLGIGGLGHMALQYARKMGFKVVAVGRGQDIAEDALRLGAHVYIDTDRDNAACKLNAMGGAKAIIATIGHPETIASLMAGLALRGSLVLLGAGSDPLSVSTGQLVGEELRVSGSLTGTPYENERTLDFCVLTGVRPQIETMPLEKAFEAYRKMKSGEVKFRMVLTMKEPCR